MLYCKKCNLHITGTPKYCPLCQGELTGSRKEAENLFPFVPPIIFIHRTMLQWILFATVVVAVICIFLNISFPFSGSWSIFVVMGFVSLWVTVAMIIKKRNNIPKNILWQVGIVSALAIFWDHFTGYSGWAINFVVPILCTCAMIAMALIAKIRKLEIEDYIVYLLLDCLFGIIPLICLLRGSLYFVYPSTICVAASLISLSALFLFEGKAFRAEIIRRMHL